MGMLVTPTVLAPVTPWTRKVRVCGASTGATVVVKADGVEAGRAVAIRSDVFVPLRPGLWLAPGQVVTAAQQIGDDASVGGSTTAGVEVLATPTRAHLEGIFSPSVSVHFGACLWLEGVIPGAQVDVWVDGAGPVTVEADWTAVHVDVPPLVEGAQVTCRQRRSAVRGPVVVLASPVKVAPPLPAPHLAKPLYQCQRVVDVSGVVPGAEVIVAHDGREHSFCCGASAAAVGLNRRLRTSDGVRAWQRLTEGGLESPEDRTLVTEAVPPGPWWPVPVCRTDAEVVVHGILSGARVEFLIGDKTVRGEAGEGQTGFVLPSLGNAARIGVRQALCANGPWSEVAWVTVTSGGTADQPKLHEVVQCATAVGVKGLAAGTRVWVISEFWKGPIGETVATGAAFTLVKLMFEARLGDRLSLRLLRCGIRRDVADGVTVYPAPATLAPPQLSPTVDDAGGAITVSGLQPGAICDVELLPKPDSAAGVPVASVPVILSRSAIPVPPLPVGWFLRCRQRLCTKVSEPSNRAEIGDQPAGYELESAKRIVALTGTRGAGGRVPRYNTVEIGLNGTDLGIPVVHKGRLYLFFGDADQQLMPDGPFAPSVTPMLDADPIAWTVEEPETPGGPWLEFLTNAKGHFKRLAVDGLEELGNFEVPTGGFSYNGRVYLFVANERNASPGPGPRMHTSHLAVTKGPDVDNGFTLLHNVSSTLHPSKTGPWLVHVSPTLVRCADWPGLPTPEGDGVVLFGTGLYQSSGIRLAFFPLSGGTIPPPETWVFYSRDGGKPGWKTKEELKDRVPDSPMPSIANQGEVSVAWIAVLRRWLAIYVRDGGVAVSMARAPYGPWIPGPLIFHPTKPGLRADNTTTGYRFVGLTHDHEPWRETVAYAPYLIPSWTRYDASERVVTLHYTLSTEHPPYNVQLMSSRLRFGRD